MILILRMITSKLCYRFESMLFKRQVVVIIEIIKTYHQYSGFSRKKSLHQCSSNKTC